MLGEEEVKGYDRLDETCITIPSNLAFRFQKSIILVVNCWKDNQRLGSCKDMDHKKNFQPQLSFKPSDE